MSHIPSINSVMVSPCFPENKVAFTPKPPIENNGGSSYQGRDVERTSLQDALGTFALPESVVKQIFPKRNEANSSDDFFESHSPLRSESRSRKNRMNRVDASSSLQRSSSSSDLSKRQITPRWSSLSVSEKERTPPSGIEKDSDSLSRVCEAQVESVHGSPIYSTPPQAGASIGRNRTVTFL